MSQESTRNSAAVTVSVIIPAHNAEAYIAETLRSALGQTVAEIEVIVVSDGSTDRTEEIVAGCADPRVRLIRTEKGSAAAARNAGLRGAKGEFIQFLDADDLLSPDKIQQQLEVLRMPGNERAVASCAWLKFTDRIDMAVLRPEPVWTVTDPAEWLICSLGGGGMMAQHGWLCRRELIDAAGPWDESLTLHDDGEFFARVLLQADRQIFVPGPRVYYRSVPGSLSRRRGRAAMESAYRVCLSRDRLLLSRRDDARARSAIATQYAQFAYEFSTAAPDLGRAALARLAELGTKPQPVIGGKAFRLLASTAGFAAALALRSRAASRKSGCSGCGE